MSEAITPAYLAILVAFSGIIFLIFHGYSTVVGKFLPALNNLVGGFVAFLAFNEIIALPFLILHWSFHLFFPIFVVLNGAAFLIGGANVVRTRKKLVKTIKTHSTLVAVVALLIVVFSAFMTQVYVKYDADDSVYVSLVQQSVDRPHLYDTDSATGNPAIPMKEYYKFESWELLKAAFVKIFHLSPLELSHGLLPLVMVPLAFLAHRLVFGFFFKDRNKVNAALILMGIILLFGGYSRYSQGAFLLTRGWLGKAELATIIIPLLFYLFLKLCQKPRDNRLYATLLIISIASVALNPAVIFVVGAALVVFAVYLVLQQRSIVPGLKIAVATVPLLLTGVGIALVKHARDLEIEKVGSPLASGAFSWPIATTRFIGSSWYFYILLIGLAALLWHTSRDIRLNSRRLTLFTVILSILIVNPFLFGIFTRFTITTYWRFYWLVPVTILVPVIGVVVVELVGKQFRPALAKLAKPLSFVAVALVFMLSGSWLFDVNKPIVVRNTSREKLPLGVSNVLEYMVTQPPGNVVATANIAIYYRTVPTTQQLFISRLLYYRHYCNSATSVQCVEQLKLFQAADGQVDASGAGIVALLEKHDIRYFIIKKGTRRPPDTTYHVVFQNEQYTVLKAVGV